MGQRRQLEGLTQRLKSVLRKAHREMEPELETRRFVHDLAMARTELEARNDELLRARDDLVDAGAERTEARALYRELYDGAPVGFLSLDRRGSIVDANLLAARLLGADVARPCLAD